MRSRRDIRDFLAHQHVAVVGPSRDRGQHPNSVCRSLRDHGYSVYPVTQAAGEIEGMPAYPNVRAVPEPLDGVLVMVDPRAALGVVDDCVARGVPRIWFHEGMGDGPLTQAAILTARTQGLRVVAGACPLTYLGHQSVVHRIQRWNRRRRHAA